MKLDELPLPVPVYWTACTDEIPPDPMFTAMQMRAAMRAGALAALDEAAKVCEKRAERRFEEHGTRELDTGATYYGGRCEAEYSTRDEEDDDCAADIRRLRDTIAKGESE